MKESGTQIIETKRLLLRPLKTDDAQMMFDHWMSDAEVTKYLTWQAHQSVLETQELLNIWVDAYQNEDCYRWGICIDENVIGVIDVVKTDHNIKSKEIGYCLSKSYWSQGIMSEALVAIVHYLFENSDVNRIEAYHDTRNPYSGAVMSKANMIKEGVLRKSDLNNQGLCDMAVYSILRSDYEGEKRK